jgi:hypothetical protein
VRGSITTGVEGESEIVARLGALRLDHADRLAERVLHESALTVLAAQRLVLGVLEPGQSRVVGAHEPEHLRGEEALRVGALRLGDCPDALDPELLDLLAARRVHLALEIDEPGLAVGELPQQLVLGPLQERRELGGHLHRVLDQERIGEDRHRVLRDGELHAVAIHDRAAARRIGHVLDLLAHGALGEGARPDRSDPGGAQRRQPEQQQEDCEQQADAALDEPHGRTPRIPLAAPGRRASLGSGHG